jgi:hypothetical protein
LDLALDGAIHDIVKPQLDPPAADRLGNAGE